MVVSHNGSTSFTNIVGLTFFVYSKRPLRLPLLLGVARRPPRPSVPTGRDFNAYASLKNNSERTLKDSNPVNAEPSLAVAHTKYTG